jgi:hypothetical protein
LASANADEPAIISAVTTRDAQADSGPVARMALIQRYQSNAPGEGSVPSAAPFGGRDSPGNGDKPKTFQQGSAF